MAAPKYNASIETRYWVEDAIGRAWPPGQDVFTGENNPKANYALDLNIDGQVMTFIPNSVIENGVYSPFSDSRISGKSYTLPWFLDTNNQAKLNEVGQKIDLSNSDVGGYLKDKMGASAEGVLVPKGSIPFDSQIVNTPGKITGISNIQGQNFYLNEDTYNQGRTFLIDNTGTRRDLLSVTAPQQNKKKGGIFGSGIGPDVSWVDLRDSLQAGAVVAGNYFVPGSSLVTSQFVTKGAKEDLASDLGQVANFAAGVQGGVDGNSIFSSTDPNAVGGITGPDNIDVGGGFNPAAGAPPTIDTIAANFYGVPAGSEYVAPQVTELGTVAGPTTEMLGGTEVAGMGGAQGLQMPSGTNLAEMGGAQGLQSGVGTSLAEMGGAQGLTTLGAAGGVLGAAGLSSGAGAGATAAGIGAGLGLSPAATGTGSLLTGVAAGAPLAAGVGAGAGTLTGSALGDMAAINAGAGLIGGALQSNAATEAAQIQAAAADRAIAAQQKNFETINAQQAPYRASGYNALNNIAGLTSGQTPQYDASGNIVRDANGNPVMTTGSGYLQKQFNAADLKAGLAPNYDFMLQQGQMANQRAANMGGGALGGNALQGLNRFTQDYAGNAYQNAFNNFQTQRGNIYNTLAGIAGIGQAGQTATNTAATNATNAATQLGVGAAGAQAAGTVGSANAYTNAINNATNNYTLASLLNQRGNVQMPIG